MKHEDEGRLMAYLDGELDGEDADIVRAHLERCAPCALSTSLLRSERELIRGSLAEMEVDASAAQRRVRERLRDAQIRPRWISPGPARLQRPGWLRRRRVLQAAVLVLFMAGGASALVPGSPLRRLFEPESGGEPAVAPTLVPAGEEAQETSPPQVSVSARPSAGRLRVSLQLPSGTELDVVLVDGDRATLHANPDTRFTSSDGVLEATVVGGPVRVELPRGDVDVSLEVGGRLYLTRQNGDLRLNAPATDSSDAEFSFRIR